MQKRETDPAEVLPNWWLWSAAGACLACIVLFAVAIASDSLVLGFVAILVLLICATVLPLVLRRHQRNQESRQP